MRSLWSILIRASNESSRTCLELPNTISLSAEAGDGAGERGGAQHGEHRGRGQGQDLGPRQEGVGILQPGLQVADAGECPRDQVVACIGSRVLDG